MGRQNGERITAEVLAVSMAMTIGTKSGAAMGPIPVETRRQEGLHWRGREQAPQGLAPVGRPSAAVGRCRRRARAIGGKGDHERPIGLGTERDAKAAATADAMDLAVASSPAAGGAGQESNALAAEDHPPQIKKY